MSAIRWLLAALVFLFACRGDNPHQGYEVTAVNGAPAVHSKVSPKPAPPPAPDSSGLVAIDLYGTRQITRDQLLAAFGKQLREYAALHGAPSLGLGESITDGIRKLGDFADVRLSLVGYYESHGMDYYLTVDVVDQADAGRRQDFLPEPNQVHEDPEGLLADWRQYESTVGELEQNGQMSSKRVPCPAFHCLGDDSQPKLAPLARTFEELVPEHVDELAQILRDDAYSQNRAAAAFLLAYMHDGNRLVQLMLPAFRDSSLLVRNNAMRVVVDIAFHHPEIEVPLAPVFQALDFPATTDRNKASAILDGLLARPGAEPLYHRVAACAGATLLDMLRLEQPNNHDFAFSILERISGRSYDERDYPAWQAWLVRSSVFDPASCGPEDDR